MPATARGPWSQPHLLEGAPGIDPDSFFDDDGKVLYIHKTDVYTIYIYIYYYCYH